MSEMARIVTIVSKIIGNYFDNLILFFCPFFQNMILVFFYVINWTYFVVWAADKTFEEIFHNLIDKTIDL